jgi:hypothetical protein
MNESVANLVNRPFREFPAFGDIFPAVDIPEEFCIF